ncbi:MAG TPA: O-antigen ligase family protein [Pyrinomonadaceae bacterium]
MWLGRATLGCLFVIAFFAPHSIAATQIGWAVGLLFWALRFAFRPRPRTYRTPVDYALLGFFILTGLSAFLSYEPYTSIGKLRAASLFTIVYLVAENVTSRRTLRLLAFALVASCSINAAYTLGQRAVGRGVKVEGLSLDSPLYSAGIRDGDTLLEVDGRTLHNPEELAAALTTDGRNAGAASVKVYRLEFYHNVPVARGRLLEGQTAQARLGVGIWSRGRDQRASGFYGHYVTYAEALQLIASLAFGLFVACPRKGGAVGRLLLTAFASFVIALILTVTRASWLALLVSSFVIVLAGAGRRAAIALVIAAALLLPLGLYVLRQKRQVAFLDRSDGSTVWRETVWREGFHLLLSKPRHVLVGVGMDSIKSHWRQWGLFDRGRLPVGHMHSNLLQLALERGLPALLAWLTLLYLYARTLWRMNKINAPDWWAERGLALGALGGLAGFLTSGLVHYNWGDSEVVMIFYFIMGLALAAERLCGNVRRAA